MIVLLDNKWGEPIYFLFRVLIFVLWCVMKVVDGVVRALNVEPRNENLGVSSADHMLQLLQAKPQETVA